MTDVHNISLRKAKKTSRNKRASKALKIIKRYLKRSVGSEVKIDNELNRKIWEKGVNNIPSKIRVRVEEEGDREYVAYLEE